MTLRHGTLAAEHTAIQLMLDSKWRQPWASEGFFPGGASRGFSQNFYQAGGKSGEICFLFLEIKITTFFC